MQSSQTEQAPGATSNPTQLEGSNQGLGGGYDQMSQSSMDSGTGQDAGTGAHGSGVAGGYSGSQQQPAEKQDWLDKGITMAGKKAGFNVVCISSTRFSIGCSFDVAIVERSER